MMRVLWFMFLGPALVTVATILAMVLLAHFSAGDKSPGLLRIAEIGMRFSIPIVIFIFFVLPGLYGVWTLFRAARLARSRGHTLRSFLALTLEQRIALRDSGPVERN